LQIRIVRVEEHRNEVSRGYQLTQQFQALRQQFAGKKGDPREPTPECGIQIEAVICQI
jgi:hypothetical protein